MSGYFNNAQAKMIMNLIPEKYKVFFENLVENNKEIKGVFDYFESLPDLWIYQILMYKPKD
jgi:hypothetical protein